MNACCTSALNCILHNFTHAEVTILFQGLDALDKFMGEFIRLFVTISGSNMWYYMWFSGPVSNWCSQETSWHYTCQQMQASISHSGWILLCPGCREHGQVCQNLWPSLTWTRLPNAYGTTWILIADQQLSSHMSVFRSVHLNQIHVMVL